MDRIDLRSDTVTWPTPAMRQAMATAPVGDDVYDEDPTVNELERLSAEMLGKEAALFVASGTMGNLVAILTHCGRGDEIILGDKGHTFLHEVGGAAAFGGVHSYLVPVQADGTLALEDIRAAVRDPADVHYPLTRLIVLENPQCGVGGIPLTPAYMAQVGALAQEFGLKLHVDGSRIFNAATALNCDVKELAAPANSVAFCLSKGLCAPVGAMLVGDADFIRRARRVRKGLGGGMRQAGILAAAGLVALREMTCRLHEDHANARRLAEGLATIPGLEVRMDRLHINMVFLRLADTVPFSTSDIAACLRQKNIYVEGQDARWFRLVTHYWIRPSHIDEVVAAFREALA